MKIQFKQDVCISTLKTDFSTINVKDKTCTHNGIVYRYFANSKHSLKTTEKVKIVFDLLGRIGLLLLTLGTASLSKAFIKSLKTDIKELKCGQEKIKFYTPMKQEALEEKQKALENKIGPLEKKVEDLEKQIALFQLSKENEEKLNSEEGCA